MTRAQASRLFSLVNRKTTLVKTFASETLARQSKNYRVTFLVTRFDRKKDCWPLHLRMASCMRL